MLRAKQTTHGLCNRVLALYSEFVALRNVAVGHLAHKVGIRVEEHDVKVLDGMDGLESGPILEPHDMILGHLGAKRPCDIVVNLCARRVGEVAGGRIGG